MKYSAGTELFAFDAQYDGYAGGLKTRPMQFQRGPDGTLLTVSGVSKREFNGKIFADSSVTGTIEYDSVTYDIGTDSDLEACLAASDLQVKSVEDSAFWNARCVSPWDPKPDHDYAGIIRTVEVRILEK